MERTSGMRTVLLVDDEPDLREVLAMCISEQNIAIVNAGGGEEALAIIRHQTIDAVLCDIQMPQMSGLELLSAVRAEGRPLPFVFMTGYPDENKMLQAIRLGVVDFIFKPAKPHEINDVVFRALEIERRRLMIMEKAGSSKPELVDELQREVRIINQLRAHNNKIRRA